MRLTQDGILHTDRETDDLIIAILRKDQKDTCATCPSPLSQGFQITHKRYGEDITLQDLELKCGPCHSEEHDYKSHTGTLRYAPIQTA